MRTNIYIRKDNEDAWLALDNKSEWVNERLGGGILTEKKLNKMIEKLQNEPETPRVIFPVVTERNKDMSFCKHDSVLGFCKKGCR